MNEKEQLAWCQRNQAIVWFSKQGVKIKVSDFTGSTKGASLQQAIASIELFRQERKQVGEALKSLDQIRGQE
ncbi:hypothetical protein [Dictyobacter formicarum]|uniref:Uncharacterized protein n=1 Tax=Dictyobacter formicarum TaxID=2778368 RepID=A0ABQ3VRA5_9CHLR|nr:hypothetical protein [Dictyobacter formicarum]GHO88224.1 hypothetical protein KSZ_62300 [Dictyobacter formicarum]